MDDDSSKIGQSLFPSLFPMETCPLRVSDEAFNLFHTMDRELFTRLIYNLGRDPVESIQVMAFWMWLERESKDMTFIKRVLSLPLALLNDVVDETVVCVRCVENDRFLFVRDIGNGGGGNEIITLLPEILNNRINVSLRLFHDNRIAVIRAVTKIINTVCARAFADILRRAWRLSAAAAAAAAAATAAEVSGNGSGPSVPRFIGGGAHEVGDAPERRIDGGGGGGGIPAGMPVLYHPHLNVPFVPLPHAAAMEGGLLHMPPPALNVLPPPVAADVIGIPIHHLLAAAGSFPGYDFAAQSQMLNNGLGNLLSRNLSINNNRSEETINGDGEFEVPADDRTIFLTFSKGYPITEDEVREFFSRRFGDFIEDLIMQEVGEDEQVLYARMVARSMAMIEGIVGENKAKYVINGKHVWARKYVKKQHQTRFPPAAGGGDDPSSPSSSSN